MLKHFFEHMYEPERQSRLFAKGDIKYVILDLLKDKPSHGYEIIHSLETHFHGFYTPSAGSVYPTLQMLEDMGYVNSSEHDGKKVYTVSDAGMRFLEESKDVVSRIQVHMQNWQEEGDRDELRDVFHETRRLTRLISRKTQRLDKKRLVEIRGMLNRTYQNIEKIVDEEE